MGNAKKRSGSVASMLPVLLACSFTASFGQSMMNVALPELAERFGVTLSIANWVIVGSVEMEPRNAPTVWGIWYKVSSREKAIETPTRMVAEPAKAEVRISAEEMFFHVSLR